MDAKEHLYYGLGIIAFAVANADGTIQASEKKELRELIKEWSEKYTSNYDIAEIIFTILSNSKPGLQEGFDEGMKYVKLGSNHLTEQMKEHFIYLIKDVAHSFPPVTIEEDQIIERFKIELHNLR